MGVRTRIEPFDRDIEAIIAADLSPEAQSRALAAFAGEALGEAQAVNAQALGRVPEHDTYIDGRPSTALETVRPDGVILFEFELLDEALLFIAEMLARRSPFRTGRYTASHALFADGVEVDAASPPGAAREYVYLNTQPYARKIERGQSAQAPDGVYEAVAALAQRRFGNQARIGFSFRSPILPYIPGAPNRAARALRRASAGHVIAAQKAERASRVPAIVVTPY